MFLIRYNKDGAALLARYKGKPKELYKRINELQKSGAVILSVKELKQYEMQK